MLRVQANDAIHSYLEVVSPPGQAAHAAVSVRGAQGSGRVVLGRSSGTSDAPEPTLNGDQLGAIQFAGYDGLTWDEGADIRVVAGADWSETSHPARVSIFTTATDSITPTERMRITTGGVVQVGSPTTPGTVELFRVSTPATVDNNAQIITRPAADTTKALVIQSRSSQTANLTEWQLQDGSVVSHVNSTGNFIGPVPSSTQTSDYTLQLTDAGSAILFSGSSSMVLTVPQNNNVAFPIGTIIMVIQAGTGQVQVASDGTSVIRATPGAYLRAQYSQASLIKMATNTWYVGGDLST